LQTDIEEAQNNLTSCTNVNVGDKKRLSHYVHFKYVLKFQNAEGTYNIKIISDFITFQVRT